MAPEPKPTCWKVLAYLKKNWVHWQSKLHKKILGEAYSQVLGYQSYPKERVAWLQDPMVQGQIFPYCKDKFYPSKTLCSVSMVAKQPLDSNLASHVDLSTKC